MTPHNYMFMSKYLTTIGFRWVELIYLCETQERLCHHIIIIFGQIIPLTWIKTLQFFEMHLMKIWKICDRRQTIQFNGLFGVFALLFFFFWRRNGGTLTVESYHTRHTEWGDGGGLAGGPQHLKPIRELWNIPRGSSTLARGHCKGPNRESWCDSDADKQPAKCNNPTGVWRFRRCKDDL